MDPEGQSAPLPPRADGVGRNQAGPPRRRFSAVRRCDSTPFLVSTPPRRPGSSKSAVKAGRAGVRPPPRQRTTLVNDRVVADAAAHAARTEGQAPIESGGSPSRACAFHRPAAAVATVSAATSRGPRGNASPGGLHLFGPGVRFAKSAVCLRLQRLPVASACQRPSALTRRPPPHAVPALW